MGIDGLTNLPGVGKPIQENIPVKAEEVAQKAGSVLETPPEEKNSIVKGNIHSPVHTDERTVRTRLRDLRHGMPERLSNENSREKRYEVKIERPPDLRNSSSTQRMSEWIKEVQKQYPLPKADDLVKTLKPDTQKEVLQASRQALSDPDLVNPKMFFETLSKMLPMGLAIINGKDGQTTTTPSIEVSTMLMQMMKDLSPHINRLLTVENLPQDMKELLQQLSQQLAAAHKVEVNSQDSGTIANRTVLQVMEQLMARLQAGTLANSKEGHLLANNLAMFQLMSSALALSGKEQAAFMQMIMSNQALFSAGKINPGMLGPNTQELANKMSELVLAMAGKMSEAVHLPLLKESSAASLLKLFSSILFGGTLLGKMIADRGDGKSWGLDESYAGMLQVQAAKELKIFDLVPFSLFASFSPLREGEELSEEQKAALKLLNELIRQLMNLVFMITSIYTAGQKIGEGGIDYLLEKNNPALHNIIEPLVITLTKIHEIFGIDIKAPLAFFKQSLDGLFKKDHPVFWSNIFAFFSDENDLNTFLEEVDELEPFYQSIYCLMAQR